MLIEPQSYVYNTFLKILHHKSPEVKTLHVAIEYENGSLPLYKVSFCNERWATDLASFNREALLKHIENGTIERLAKKYQVQLPASTNDYISHEEVTVISPKEIIKQYNITILHFLMVNTEGFDFEVIKIFDAAGFTPEVMLFEHSHLSNEELNECLSFLTGRGFIFKMIKANTLAIKLSSPNVSVFKEVFNI